MHPPSRTLVLETAVVTLEVAAVVLASALAAAGASALPADARGAPCAQQPASDIATIDAVEPIEVAASGDRGLAVLPPTPGDAGWPRLVALERDGSCRWQPLHDQADAFADAVATLRPTVAAFEQTAATEGTATALHVYLLDAALQLSIDRTATFRGAAEVNPYLLRHPIDGIWHTALLRGSKEGPWVYAEGTLSDPRQRSVRRFLELWQYDPRVANYGLRLLWFGQPAAPTAAR